MVLGSPILYLKGMRIMMFQLSGFYCKGLFFWFWDPCRPKAGKTRVRMSTQKRPELSFEESLGSAWL